MNKILNYIIKGHGIGTIIILFFSVLISSYQELIIRTAVIDSIPYIQMVADEILPLKLENGTITLPKDMKKSFPLYVDKTYGEIPFVIDTSSKEINVNELKSGIYLTKTSLYTVNNINGKITNSKLRGDLYLEKKDYTQNLKDKVKWFMMLVTILLVIKNFLVYFIANLLYTLLSEPIIKANNITLNFDAKMRLSAVCLFLILSLSFILQLIGLNLNLFAIIILMIISQYIITKKINNKASY